ncbi:MAG: hypothetical protein QF380_06945 [Candidatus Marinimicrobia bacterium]|nr:hypothetical protein [Candidatus Neomarinimicrobiota bacterium]
MKFISALLISLGNYIQSHRAGFYIWLITIFAFFSILFAQKMESVSSLIKLNKENELIKHEQKLFLEDFVRQGHIINQQADQMELMKNQLNEAGMIIRLQTEAIKELIENHGRFKPDSKFQNPEGVRPGVEA